MKTNKVLATTAFLFTQIMSTEFSQVEQVLTNKSAIDNLHFHLSL